tara:strand:+ start:76 stop:1206 length:1131 start_codon:yes stop_codon:yes gene_type:complete
MKVLSLFDGMSCGRIALDSAGINVTSYHASELDKYAIQVTQANWPETVQLGDVTQWREWDIDWKGIDLLIGGSPCQGFSFAGKQLAFDDPRSKLFFVYVDILKHIRTLNPDVKFMLENVRMKKEYLAIISEQLGVEPVFINSALVSAQNRQRFYWANWKIEQPEDKGILLADILENDPDNTTFMSEKFKARNAHILRDDLEGKSKSLSAMEYVKNGRQGDYINPAAIVGRKLDENGKRNDKLESKPVQCLEVHEQGKSRCLSTVAKDTVVSSLPKGRYPIGMGYNRKDGLRNELTKAYPLNATDWRGLNRNQTQTAVVKDKAYRKLTPIECERLQTVPDNATALSLSIKTNETTKGISKCGYVSSKDAISQSQVKN